MNKMRAYLRSSRFFLFFPYVLHSAITKYAPKPINFYVKRKHAKKFRFSMEVSFASEQREMKQMACVG